MQTFLPYESFEGTFRCLDRARLGKQRVEAWQVWLATARTTGGWINHPAVRMWRGHEWWLLLYGLQCCEAWIARGYRDSLLTRFLVAIERVPMTSVPPWLGSHELHASHRSNLLRKDPVHYGRFGWTEPPTMGYHWPHMSVQDA